MLTVRSRNSVEWVTVNIKVDTPKEVKTSNKSEVKHVLSQPREVAKETQTQNA